MFKTLEEEKLFKTLARAKVSDPLYGTGRILSSMYTVPFI